MLKRLQEKALLPDGGSWPLSNMSKAMSTLITQQNGYWIVELPDGTLFEWTMEKALRRVPVLRLFDKKSLARITTIKIPNKNATNDTKA